MICRSIICITGLIFLSACASTGSGTSANGTTAREQAAVNTALGREYMNRGQFEIALEKLKKATSADSSYAPAHTVLAVLYEQIRQPELAERHYREAVKMAPENGDVNNNFGVFLCKNGEADKAEIYFLRAIEDPFYRTPAVAFTNAGSCELQSGNLDKAERYLRQSLEYDAEFPDTLFAMANVYSNKGDFFRARAFLQRYEGVGPATAASLTMGSHIETQLKNSGEAQDYIDRLLINFPQSEQARQIRGEPQ